MNPGYIDIVDFTSKIPDQNFIAADLPYIQNQIETLHKMVSELNILRDDQLLIEDEVTKLLDYIKREINIANAQQNFSKAEFIINRYKEYVENAHAILQCIAMRF